MWNNRTLSARTTRILYLSCAVFGLVLVALLLCGCSDDPDTIVTPPVIDDEITDECHGRVHMCNTLVCDQLLSVQCVLVPQYEAMGYQVGLCENFPDQCLTWDDESDDERGS
jgi:hypothetical protein